MKKRTKISLIVLLATTIFMLSGYNTKSEYEISITIPAGSQEEFVYSYEEISPLKSQITISNGEDLGDTEVVLKPIEVKQENAYEPNYITKGMPIKMDVEKGAWFKVGVSVQNPTDEDMVVHVSIKDVEVRIE